MEENADQTAISQDITRQGKWSQIFNSQRFKIVKKYLPFTIIIILAIIIRIIAALYSEGFIHPDEVFQSIEMVHYRIFGKYGSGQTIPWEFNENYTYGGARSWFFVLVLATIYRFFMFFGVADPLVLITIARVFLALSSIITVIVAYLFGKEMFSEKVGLVASFLCAIWWFFPFWASRTMTDALSSDLMFLSIFLVYLTIKKGNMKEKISQTIIAGIVLGVAFMLRFPAGLMGIPLFFFLLVFASIEIHKLRKNKDTKPVKKREYFKLLIPTICFTGSALGMVLIQGLLDLATWGNFLQSPINFFMYNIVEGYNAIHGTSPWYSYFIGFFTDFASYYLPLFLVLLFIGLAYKEDLKEKIYFAVIGVYWITIFSSLAHKEFRFIFVFIPFALIFIANGIIKFSEVFSKKKQQLLAIGILLGMFSASSLSMALYHQKFMWTANSGICNAMHWVGTQNDVETVLVLENIWYTGGYAYLNQNVTCIFIHIYFWTDPSTSYNSTYYRDLYQQNGTYIVVRAPELIYVYDIFTDLGLEEISTHGAYPYAFVYKKIN